MQQTDRVTLTLAGQTFSAWTQLEITRDLSQLCGSFVFNGLDLERVRRVLGGAGAPGGILKEGAPATIAIDGETVLVGYVDAVQLRGEPDNLVVAIQGRDKAGDLVDCTAAPRGPVEYRNLRLDEIARRICEPFGVTVRADADLGPPFPVFAVDATETAMSAIEKAARQRGILVVSDGVGGLRLTTGGGGAASAPAAIRFGQNVVELTATRSWEDRFSLVLVRGWSAGSSLSLTGIQPIDVGAAPAAAVLPGPAPELAVVQQARARIGLGGEATDPEIDRWRPRVLLTRTQSGGASAKTQAEWAVRVARSAGRTATYTVPDWRAGAERRLWRPNEIVTVDDPYTDFLEDMLVAGVVYSWGEDGARTRIRVVGRHALDLVAEGEDRPRQRLAGRSRPAAAARPLDGTARPLTAE